MTAKCAKDIVRYQKVFIKLGFTDMRKQINGLSALVQELRTAGPFDGSYFLFCGKTRHVVKILYWDRNGFCLWHKRLERQVFRWPTREAEVMAIDSRQLAWLLDGLDPLTVKGHSRLEYSAVI